MNSALFRADSESVAARRFHALLIALLIVLAVLSVFSLKILFADGAFVQLEMLRRLDFWIVDPGRFFSLAIAQAPAVAAIWAGVDSIYVISAVFSAGAVAWQIGAILSALWLTRRQPVARAVVLLYLVLIYAQGGFFIEAEYNMFSTSAILAFALIVTERVAPLRALAALAVVALVLTRAYEAALFVNVVLIAGLWLRYRRPMGAAERVFLIVITLLLAAGVWQAVSSVINPRDAANATGFREAHFRLVTHVLLGFGVLVAAIALRADMCGKRWAPLLVALAVVYAVAMVFRPRLMGIEDAIYNRVLTAAPMALLLAAGFWAALRMPRLTIDTAHLALAACIFIAFQVYATVRWWAFIDEYRLQLACHTGLVNVYAPSTGLNQRKYNVFVWSWTNPSLSLLLRPPGSNTLFENAIVMWQPFKPRNPAEVPTITRFTSASGSHAMSIAGGAECRVAP